MSQLRVPNFRKIEPAHRQNDQPEVPSGNTQQKFLRLLANDVNVLAVVEPDLQLE